MTRNGNDKAKQFPEITGELSRLATDLGAPVVLDGELVGLRQGEIVRFESLQGRMHLTGSTRIATLAREEPAALVVFDVILRGETPLVHESWRRRREELEEILDTLTGGGDEGPAFAYTVGLFGLGHPELLIFGVYPEDALAVLNDLHRRGMDKDVSVVVWGEFGRSCMTNSTLGIEVLKELM